MSREKRILYVQYTNPGAYPPLEHSSRILADSGWRVRFLGTESDATNRLAFPPHPNIAVRLRPFQQPGWRQKLHYLSFMGWCLRCCLTWRPNVVYCSDPLSAPIGVFVWYLLRLPVVYHEHDAPGQPTNVILRLVHAMRRRLARVAAACVVPQKERLSRFVADLKPRHAMCVWNCPRLAEVSGPKTRRSAGTLKVLYHGSIVPERVPESLVRALVECPPGVSLTVIGYETIGAQGYIDHLVSLSRQMNCAERFHVRAAVSRFELWRHVREHDVGCGFVPRGSGDANLSAMIGASNKVYDYLAAGLALMTSRLPDWEAEYTAYGRPADPNDPKDVAAAWNWFLERPDETRSFGEAGRRRILDDWNYERQFEPIRSLLGTL